jgi:DNA modification methylase
MVKTMSVSAEAPLESKQRTNVRRYLSKLLTVDLDFHQDASNEASHSLHAFAAKFPPQLPRLFIEGLTQKGEAVMDPMMGSGTAVVEAFLCDRRALGFDIDPLALMICSVKTHPVDLLQATWAGKRVVSSAVKILQRASRLEPAMRDRFSPASLEFISYWFAKQTQRELMAILLAIEREDLTPPLVSFLKVVFSSIIITKSGGVSRAYDLAHTRPHLLEGKPYKDAIKAFEVRLNKSATLLSQLPSNGKHVEIQQCDCRRQLPLEGDSVQLIVTSPPYANAIDYMRAHKFSLVWFGEDIKSLSSLRSTYIGSEKAGVPDTLDLPTSVCRVLQNLQAVDGKKGRVLAKYFTDMRLAFCEMFRVLEPGRCCVVVVGPSTMRGQTIKTHELLSDVGNEIGFETVDIAERKLDRDRRMLPAAFRRNHNSQIESRMHEEYIIGFVKP